MKIVGEGDVGWTKEVVKALWGRQQRMREIKYVKEKKAQREQRESLTKDGWCYASSTKLPLRATGFKQ